MSNTPRPSVAWWLGGVNHVFLNGYWNHEYDAYYNHPASGAKAARKGVSVDWVLCDCAHVNGTAPCGPIPQPNYYDAPGLTDGRSRGGAK